MLSLVARRLKPHMIYRQLSRRVALTPFDVGPLAQAHRNLSLAFGASARSIVHTAPRRASRKHSTVQVLSADRLLCRTAYLLMCLIYDSTDVLNWQASLKRGFRNI